MSGKATFYLIKSKGHLDFAGPYQEKIYRDWIKNLDDRQVVKMDLAKKRDMKTNAQLGYWYGVVLKHALPGFIGAGHDSMRSTKAFGRTREYATSEDDVDEFLKREYAECNELEPIGKREMTDQQMSALIEWTIDWMAKYLHVVCPEPETTLE